ncbi:MAG TPA: methylenetetrahydrofolate reductase C-terminal domain-containing protein [Dehalococcoidia bacterium]|nr:methylenetetrahydrofolate reductase [Chloroflexota bacterium]MDP5876569.1 methylenetetrahydrofolate reductase C-terminal domain-containing protein [Dehalococcoidia bacterium]MDP6274028.1 methylenetetrahydrofolate reductase C-terminal domain-containing protein [Dehalococcoidia bacterium]MDP7161274.1 methylenetetrahydrofolate reductase C-terminal domain-containing protein [Dehalococcoidia bacterium]MDP7213153.1 methylenetetrahydrofolate reductase C-terminal domain-containing protein [Dehalococ
MTQPASSPTSGSFRHLLEETDRFIVAVELETTRGLAMEESSSRTLSLARRLAGSNPVDLICITDNPGGNPHIRPEVMGYELLARGQEVVINFSCKDYNRNGIESRLWSLGSLGFDNVLAVTGDYPITGHAGGPQPVFDIDSVGLLEVMRKMNGGLEIPSRRPGGDPSRLRQTSFFPGVAINPFKSTEAELLPQLFKFGYKIRTGAAWAVTQIGYDSRKLDELKKYAAVNDMDIPILGSVYVLNAPAARVFHHGGIPGITVPDELFELVQKHADSEDRGRAFFEEFAAKQIAVLRGIGYRGVYLSGRLPLTRIRRILDLEASFGPDDWREFSKEIQFQKPGEFNYYERDQNTGLASDQVNREYLESKTAKGMKRARGHVSPAYKAGRTAHGLVFDSAAPASGLARKLYWFADKRRKVGDLLHLAEQAVKIPMYGCRDCGDCSLPDIAYLCPESQCAKNQRNGPCGGSHDGICEVGDKRCIWVKAYERTKAYGEEETILDRPVVFKNGALRGTSAWGNTFLKRDHNAPVAIEGNGSENLANPDAGGSANGSD